MDSTTKFLIFFFAGIMLTTIYCLTRKIKNMKEGIRDEDDPLFKTGKPFW